MAKTLLLQNEYGSIMPMCHNIVFTLSCARTAGDLQLLELADTLEVTAAIRDFFLTARASRQPQTGSSGDTEKASQTSAN